MEQVIGEYPKVMSRIEWKHAQLTTFIANLIRPSKFKVNVQYDTHTDMWQLIGWIPLSFLILYTAK